MDELQQLRDVTLFYDKLYPELHTTTRNSTDTEDTGNTASTEDTANKIKPQGVVPDKRQ